MTEHDRQLAEAVRAACIKAAQQGYEQAAISGLCDEGALEVALDAIRMLDVRAVLTACQQIENDALQ